MNLRPECVIKMCESLRFETAAAGGMIMASFSCVSTGDKRTCLFPCNTLFDCPFYSISKENRLKLLAVPERGA